MMKNLGTAVIAFLGWCLFTSSVMAQKTISGTISDAQTGERLPSANILVKGTYKGTITSSDGKYTITLQELPATLVVRYIGYKTEERAITMQSESLQNFKLEPTTIQMDEIVVTDENPAIRIMREVIKRKQQWRKKLETYKASAYTRQTLANDTSIVSISESITETFWDHDKGHREVVKSKKQTSNLSKDQNWAGVGYLPNFYDDNIKIAGFDLPGPTNPDAFRFYNFRLEGYQKIDDNLVYEIKVEPRKKLQPAFEGTVYVLDRAYALLQVKLKPNRVVDFPPPVQNFNTYYEQQFNNFGKDFWLPVDVRINGDIKIKMVGLDFPLIQFKQLSRITDYKVNVPLPDSLYKKKDLFVVDSASVKSDSLITNSIETVPLSREEAQAYTTVDSSATLEKAFKPSGFLARFVDMDDSGDHENRKSQSKTDRVTSEITQGLQPDARFNRVDAFYLGAQMERPLADHWKLYGLGGYSTGYGQWSYGGGLSKSFGAGDRLVAKVMYKAFTDTRYHSVLYTPMMSSLQTLAGYADYYDYYRNEGIKASLSYKIQDPDISTTVSFNDEKHTSINYFTNYDLLGSNKLQRVNPAINPGWLRSVGLNIGYGDAELNYGITGRKYVGFQVEHADQFMGSDFSFTQYGFSAEWELPTFLKRRILPNVLDVSAQAGTFSGSLPLQKFGAVDGTIGFFSPFGSLKTLRYQPYEGEQYAVFTAEHNFRSVPFELLGMRRLVDKNIGLIIFGGAGRTWIGDSRLSKIRSIRQPAYIDHWHTEAGISLNGLFGLFRLDFATRLDEPALVMGLSLAHLF